jgi:N-acetylmuramoyl-L-alanine amidase
MLFITIHETGNSNRGANARAHGNYLRSDTAANLPVSWHYTVDDTEIRQHLPENEDAFHAGDGAGSGNRQSIGIEICVNSDGDFRRAIDRTVLLVADICQRRNIPIENIRQHFDWNRKNCPQNIRAGRPITWSAFLDGVRTAMAAASLSEPTSPAPPAEPTPPSSRQLFRVQVGAFSVRSNAEAMLARVRAAGFADAFITN